MDHNHNGGESECMRCAAERWGVRSILTAKPCAVKSTIAREMANIAAKQISLARARQEARMRTALAEYAAASKLWGAATKLLDDIAFRLDPDERLKSVRNAGENMPRKNAAAERYAKRALALSQTLEALGMEVTPQEFAKLMRKQA